MTVKTTTKLRLIATAAVLFLTPFAQPALAKAPHHHHHAASALAHPALWKVSDEDTTIYLFGTIHLMTKDSRWYDGKIARAFGSSGELVTEILEKSPEEMKSLLVTKAMLPEGQNLRDLLSPKDRAAYEKAMQAQSLPVAAFDRFQPWFAAVSLVNFPMMRAGFNPADGVDAQLSAKAEAAHMPHDALETPEFQLGLFSALPMEAQKRYLREVVKNMPTLSHDLKAVIVAWKAGKTGKIARLINTEDDDPQLSKALLTDRNINWAQWIKTRLARPGTVFVAVGAGHLAGAGSVQHQLKVLGIATSRLQ